MDKSFQNVFVEEAIELFNALEKDLIDFETHTDDKELINKVFRELHTLKGSGAMFGFQRLSRFSHELETLFDNVRTNKIPISPDIVSLSLVSLDLLKIMLDNADDEDVESIREQDLTAAIHQFIPAVKNHDTVVQANEPSKKAPIGRRHVFRICFKPQNDIFVKGINPVVVIRNLESLGNIFTFAHEEEVPSIFEINPEFCYIFWTCIVITPADVDAIKDIFIFVEGSCELSITEIYYGNADIEEQSIPLIGDILLQKGDITQAEIDMVLSNRKLFGERAVELGFTSPEKVASAVFEQNSLKTIKKEMVAHTSVSSIRVPNEKLDTLTNAVSELVTLQARLTQFAGMQRETELTVIAEYLEKLTSSLRDTVMMIRMVPVEEGFSSMHRLVRDLAKELNKEVHLQIIGGDTELDKTVMDHLKDPMMHLIRNCIDHGLEQANIRSAAGKPPAGQISIKAEHIGSHVVISVIDDGKGLDAERILAKAVEKGLVTSSETLLEEEIFQFVFLPGFSTAEKTTNISGRGVGMDVVKKNIESIRGEVSILSEKGHGTTIRMKLPITLAIIDGLLFSIGEELFVVNIAIVSECLELTPEIRKAAGGENILRLREAIVPFVSLRELLNIPGVPPDHEQVIIMQTSCQTLGFVVDSVWGKHQTVVKTTSRLFSNVKEVTGATILGDGRIALILDVNMLAQKIHGTPIIHLAHTANNQLVQTTSSSNPKE